MHTNKVEDKIEIFMLNSLRLHQPKLTAACGGGGMVPTPATLIEMYYLVLCLVTADFENTTLIKVESRSLKMPTSSIKLA